jgi:thiamine-phosphate pyrophosphorylase
VSGAPPAGGGGGSGGARERIAGLHVLADDDPRWRHDPVSIARAACAGGAAVVQLRAKTASDRRALALAAAIRALTRAAGACFVVNDRFDLALAAGADGVHLGQEDLPPERIPPELRRRLLVGRSTHTLEQVRKAVSEPIDYVAFGPVFGTASKDSPWEARGVDSLAEAVRLAAPLPLVAIGGIDTGRAARLRETGCAGIAVISAVAAQEDALAATRALVAALRGSAA